MIFRSVTDNNFGFTKEQLTSILNQDEGSESLANSLMKQIQAYIGYIAGRESHKLKYRTREELSDYLYDRFVDYFFKHYKPEESGLKETYKPEKSDLKGWLIKLINWQLFKFRRSKDRPDYREHAPVSVDQPVKGYEDESVLLRDIIPSPQDFISEHEVRDIYERSKAELPEEYYLQRSRRYPEKEQVPINLRRVLDLIYEGYSKAEIARELGIPKSSLDRIIKSEIAPVVRKYL